MFARIFPTFLDVGNVWKVTVLWLLRKKKYADFIFKNCKGYFFKSEIMYSLHEYFNNSGHPNGLGRPVSITQDSV
jgi:hypothetical protein